MSDKFSHEELGFGDVQTDERPKTVTPATQTTVPQPVAPPASTPLPTKAIAAVPVMPPSPRMPAAKNKTSAEDILPSLPEMPDVTKDPAFIKNAETAGAVGAGTVGLLTLLGLGGAALTAHLAKKYAPSPAVPTGPELTINPNEIGAAEAPKTTIQSRSFSPKEAAVAGNITDKYPFSLQEAKTGLGIPDVKITNPTDAELVAKQYSRQIQAAAPTTPAAVPAPVVPAPAETVQQSATEVAKETKTKKPKHVQPPGTGAGDNWIHNLGGSDFYKDVIRTQNNGKPINNMEDAYKAVNKYANEVGRYKPFQQGAPNMNIEAMEAARPKSGNFGKLPIGAVPPPSLQAAPQLGGGGGSMMRGLTDPLQLKQ
jgi:hypothetical protein